jgi:hypothetical protein
MEKIDRTSVDGLLLHTIKQNDCLIWNRCLNSEGYARLAPNIKVHRLIYSLVNPEEDLTNKVIRHTCDTPSCVNPKHLLSGTLQENCQDRQDRNRTFKLMSEEQVKRVWELKDSMTQKEIGYIVNLDPRRISEILTGKRNMRGSIVAGIPAGGV